MAVLINLIKHTITCRRCHIPQAIDQFTRRYKSGKFVLACRKCYAKKSATWRKKSPDKWKALYDKYYSKKKAERRQSSSLLQPARDERKAYRAATRKDRIRLTGKRLEQTKAVIEYRKAYKARPDRQQRTRELARRPHVQARANERNRERRKTDTKFNIENRMSCAIYSSLRRRKAGRTWESVVGYGLAELMAHLEALFLPGMSWGNIGKWEIDHIIPKAAFVYTTDSDQGFKDCWSLANLQPLWMSDNRRKRAKIGWNGRLF